jgi:hypothetical protein
MFINIVSGGAMGQATSHRSVTAKSQVHVRVSICGGKIGTGAGFSPNTSVLTCQFHSTAAFHSDMSPGGWTLVPLKAAVQRQSLHRHEQQQHIYWSFKHIFDITSLTFEEE